MRNRGGEVRDDAARVCVDDLRHGARVGVSPPLTLQTQGKEQAEMQLNNRAMSSRAAMQQLHKRVVDCNADETRSSTIAAFVDVAFNGENETDSFGFLHLGQGEQSGAEGVQGRQKKKEGCL
mmetsp:Transcript_18937/g.40683  ORF Transcript_18937/g.40683 Transcript_18937/m.40683 type:complete len:122 (-) Transcript_18937:66-431(-)